MLRLSQRIANLSASPTLALNAKANALKAQGKKVLNFGVGEPDFGTPSVVTDAAIAAMRQGRTKYGPAGGGLPLRQAIVDKLQRDNQLTIKANQVVVGIGAKELLFHIALALLNEGDEVIIPAPYWVSYASHVEAAGALTVVIPMPDDHKAPRLTPAMIQAHVTERTKALILNSPNNPAGYILKENELRALGTYLKTTNFWIIADEMYEYMDFDAPHVSLLRLFPELADRFILVNGLSKGFAMTGWRVGYCAGPDDVMELVRNLQSHSSTCLPPFIEDAAVVALQKGRDLLGADIQRLKARRDLAVEHASRVPGISFVPPEGAFYLYLDIRDRLRSSKYGPSNSLAFSEALLEKHLVALVPGEAFGTPGFLRLSYAVNEADIVEGIQRLAKALDEISPS